MVRFSIDRRWATLVVAVLLGAGGGSLIGFVTAPAPGGDAQSLAPVPEVASSTTRRQGSRFAGVSSTTTRPRRLPAATAGLSPATTSTTSTARPTTTTVAPTTSTTVAPSTTTTTTVSADTTTTSSTSTVSSSTTTSTA
jgi:hypothetical protein